MDIKDIIRKRRLELGLTYEELGKRVGVGKSTVRKWETGMIENMKRDNIIALAKALNISPAVLMGWEDAKDKNADAPEEYTSKNKVTDVKQAMEVIMAQPGLMLNGEILSDESKIALANAIQMGLAYAEQMNKKNKGNNKDNI